MPIYAFTCPNTLCAQARVPVDRLVASWRVEPTCATCGAPLEKQPSVSTFQLKGAGWAKDGYQ